MRCMEAIEANVPTQPHSIAFTLGSRRIFSARRLLTTVGFTLEHAMSRRMPDLPRAPDGDGLRILSAPVDRITQIRHLYPDYIAGGQQRYRRHFIAMDGTFEDYLDQFSGKTRSTLRRKRRKLETAGGGTLDLRAYRTPDEIDAFFAHALPLSRKTYQARLLDAGLPETRAERAHARKRADDDRLRAFLLFLDGKAIAYLYLPVEGSTLVYAFLGYDPDHAALSPGTVLQMAALEELFAEERFAYFDFTEGEGAHKAMFGTSSVECASFLLLKPTRANHMLLAAQSAFEGAVGAGKALAEKLGLSNRLRQALRRG